MNDIIKRLKKIPKEKVLKLRDNYQRFFAIFPKLKEEIDLRAFYQNFVTDSLIYELAKVIMYVEKNEKYVLSKNKLINLKKSIEKKYDKDNKAKFLRYFSIVSAFKALKDYNFYYYLEVDKSRGFILTSDERLKDISINVLDEKSNPLTYGVNYFVLDLRNIAKNYKYLPKTHKENKSTIQSLLRIVEAFNPVIRIDIDNKSSTKDKAILETLYKRIKEKVPYTEIAFSSNYGFHIYIYVDYLVSIKNPNNYRINNSMHLKAIAGIVKIVKELLQEINEEYKTNFVLDTKVLNPYQGVFFEERSIPHKENKKSKYIKRTKKVYSFDDLKPYMIDYNEDKKIVNELKTLFNIYNVKVFYKKDKVVRKEDFYYLVNDISEKVKDERRIKKEDEYLADIYDYYSRILEEVFDTKLTDEMKDFIAYIVRKQLIDIKVFKEYERLKFKNLGSYKSTALACYFHQEIYKYLLNYDEEEAYEASVRFIKHHYNRNRYINPKKEKEIISRIEKEKYGKVDEERVETLKPKIEKLINSIISGRLLRSLDHYKLLNLLLNTFYMLINQFSLQLPSTYKPEYFIYKVLSIINISDFYNYQKTIQYYQEKFKERFESTVFS